MKRNTSVTLDSDLIDKVRRMGMSVSGVAEKAMETLADDGFDDFTLNLKIRMYQDAICEIDTEEHACNKRLEELHSQRTVMEQAVGEAQEQLVLARTVGRLAKLTQQLNKVIIMNNYNDAHVSEKAYALIGEMLTLNPEFNLKQHILSLRRILND
jgi:hypothetical protein